jgi:prepilin-type N-terminal cleavage/methylation domain-containing protein
MKIPSHLRAFTLIELLVVITIIGILATIAIPAIGNAVDKAKLTASMKSAQEFSKGWYLALVDVEGGGDTNVAAWPGTNLNFWYQSLTNYISTNDLIKIFSAGDVRVTGWTDAGPQNSAYYVYAVSDSSPGDAILMTTKNWLAPASGAGPALTRDSKPFGDKGAIVIKKGGSAQIINARQATNDISSIGYTTNCLNQ